MSKHCTFYFKCYHTTFHNSTLCRFHLRSSQWHRVGNVDGNKLKCPMRRVACSNMMLVPNIVKIHQVYRQNGPHGRDDIMSFRLE